MTQRVIIPTNIHENLSSIPGLAQWVKDQCCHELWCRLQMWPRYGVAMAVAQAGAKAPIPPLAWEPPYATGAAQKDGKKKKKRTALFLYTY